MVAVPALPSSDGSIIDTPAGPTFVRKIGWGPPCTFIHGGPGFDHSYLLEPLMSVAERRTLYTFAGALAKAFPPAR